MMIGLARVSPSVWIKNTAALYIEFIRGIPMLVFIFAIAFSIAPAIRGAAPCRCSTPHSSPKCSGPGSSRFPHPKARRQEPWG